MAAKAVDESVAVATLLIKDKERKRLRKQPEEVRKLNDAELSTKLEESKKSLLTGKISEESGQRREAVSEKDEIERELVRLSLKHLIRDGVINGSY